jgi:hypothetical protein
MSVDVKLSSSLAYAKYVVCMNAICNKQHKANNVALFSNSSFAYYVRANKKSMDLFS